MKIQSEGIYTYTTERIPLIGSCELLLLHPDDKCFLKVRFHVVSVEGSSIVSCATSINLNLIQTHNELERNVPDCARLYYSSADRPRATHEKQKIVDHTVKSDKNCQDPNWRGEMPARKHKSTVTCPKTNNCSIPSRNQDDNKNCQYIGVKGRNYKDSKYQITRETVFYDKKCQETNMQTVYSIPQAYGRLCQDQTCQKKRVIKVCTRLSVIDGTK